MESLYSSLFLAVANHTPQDLLPTLRVRLGGFFYTPLLLGAPLLPMDLALWGYPNAILERRRLRRASGGTRREVQKPPASR